MSLEHLRVLENKEVLKQKRDVGHRSQLKEALSSQSWDNWKEKLKDDKQWIITHIHQ